MTTIIANIKNSGSQPLVGLVRVSLQREITNGDVLVVTEPVDFPLVSGQVTFTLAPSELQNTPYLFEIIKTVAVPADTVSDPPIAAYTAEELLYSFSAVVPDFVTPLSLDDLKAEHGLLSDNTDASFVSLARRLYFSQDFWNTLNGQLFRARGVYSSSAFYARGDVVSFDGSSYLMKQATTVTNVVPTDTSAWVLLASKGAVGTGTAGNPQVYDTIQWNGASDAPSRGVIRDLVENTLATKSALNLKADITGASLIDALTSTTPIASDSSTKLANTAFVQTLIAAVSKALCPIGSGMDWYTDTAPSGWLICDGRAISRTTYSALFAVLGTTFGTGNGTTTFNLPDARGRVLVGKDSTTLAGSANVITASIVGTKVGTETHTLTVAQMPSHSHRHAFYSAGNEAAGYGLTVTAGFADRPFLSAPYNTTGALIENTGSGASHPIMQPSLIIHHIIYTGVI